MGWDYCINTLVLLFHSVVWAERTSRASLHAYSVFHVKASEVRGKYGYATNKPHYGFVVYPLFVFYVLNTHIVNRMAVSLFIGQG